MFSFNLTFPKRKTPITFSSRIARICEGQIATKNLLSRNLVTTNLCTSAKNKRICCSHFTRKTAQNEENPYMTLFHNIKRGAFTWITNKQKKNHQQQSWAALNKRIDTETSNFLCFFISFLCLRCCFKLINRVKSI